MTESRINVIGQNQFNPREWLRREVLWASLMTPYSRQLATWLDGTAYDHHMGNKTRQSVYQQENDPEAQSLGFFNQGKNIAGMISSVALFDACTDRDGFGAHVNIPGVQARSVDTVIDRLGDELSTMLYPHEEESEIFSDCTSLVKQAVALECGNAKRNIAFSKAGVMMTWLASAETARWLENAKQDISSPLPILEIQDGGFPRSAGSRVDKLQPVFKKIVASELYKIFDQP